jgi:hypothetical protein
MPWDVAVLGGSAQNDDLLEHGALSLEIVHFDTHWGQELRARGARASRLQVLASRQNHSSVHRFVPFGETPAGAAETAALPRIDARFMERKMCVGNEFGKWDYASSTSLNDDGSDQWLGSTDSSASKVFHARVAAPP